MARREHLCDVPGCGRQRKRWQRLCDVCFAALPGDIRTGIIEHHRHRRHADHRKECRRAADHLAERALRRAAFTPLEEGPEQWWQRD